MDRARKVFQIPEGTPSKYVQQSDFEDGPLPQRVLVVQDCNIGGSYYRCFFVDQGVPHCFVSSVHFFRHLPYDRIAVHYFSWLLTLNEKRLAWRALRAPCVSKG